ncbi:MAG: M48 family metalloprotease [Gemmatimonadota bacterium]|nr:M48 family metalloprotease [Gemmatimonadota bacterium]
MFRSRLAILTVVVALTACAVNPATGKKEFMLVSESQELAMGKQYDQQLVVEMGLYDDQALAGYVQELGLKLAALSERPQLPWAFRLVDDPVVNAFAVPGGYIYITRGILANMSSEAQLVSVLGHEIGHVTARHTAQQMTQQQLFGLGLGVGAMFSPTIAGIASGAVQVLFLKFSRDDESQADELGFRYMRAARYDPREAADLFAQLARVSATAGSRLPEWQSTHPDPENRRAKALARAAALPATELSGTLVRRDEYLNRLDGMVYGANPREGYFIDARFVHPDLAFEVTFPAGWPHVNQRTVVGAQSAEQDAVVMLTLAEGGTPTEAAQGFFATEGISGTPTGSSINGLAATGGIFTAQTQQGAIHGEIQFIAHGGMVFQVMGYAPADKWSSRRAAVHAALASFRRVADQQLLGVQPWRVDIVRLDRTLTPTEFAQRYPGPVSADDIALINQVDAGGRFMNRNLAKRVVGTPFGR